MTSLPLAQAYLVKATKRLRALAALRREDAFSDVVREAQEIVELATKAVLRAAGIDPPHWHDVGPLLLRHQDKIVADVRPDLPRVAEISARLRAQRELSFYGDDAFNPIDEYDAEDADAAMADAGFVVDAACRAVPPPEP